jgi:hypothetical protein
MLAIEGEEAIALSARLWGKEIRFGLVGRVGDPFRRRRGEDFGGLPKFDAVIGGRRVGTGDASTTRLSIGWTARTLFSGPVASVRSMRWRQAQRLLRWRENARSRRAAPPLQWLRSRARLGSRSRGEIVAGFHRAGWPILGRPDWLRGIAVGAVVSDAIAEATGEQAVRLGAQKLRPAGADPPRRRPESRGTQDVRDRGRGNADAELQQLTLDARVAPTRILPRQSRDQAVCVGRKRATTGPATASATSLQQRPVPAA